jgi:glutamate racemase
MFSQNPPIAILDSGVGGLSIFQSVRKSLGHHSFIYGCDNKNFPYGPKTEQQVTECITSLAEAVANRYSPAMMIIACNTASTVALESLRKKISIPIVGVVPAIKPAALKTLSGTFGLLATPGTIQRPYTEQLIRENASQCRVIKVGSTSLVRWAEEKLRGKKVNLEKIREELAPFFPEGGNSPIDTIVLGCTHFPLLLEELSACVPKPIHWIDSSAAIAKRVSSLLRIPQVSEPEFHAVFTEMNPEVKKLESYLSQLGFLKIYEISL